jgi:uncharacterized protein (TIGR02145 family)
MKKRFLLCLTAFCLALLCAAVSVFGQFGREIPKVAVYVAGGKNANEYRALSAIMLEAFVKSGKYAAIERADAFTAEIDREQTKQRSGAVDDAQISQLGKQSGVSFVCVVDVTPAFGEFQLSARLIDVETARVMSMNTIDSKLSSMAELRQAAGELVDGILGTSGTSAQSSVNQPQPASKPTSTPEPSGPSFTDSRDGQTYRTVKIGNVTWMAENLNYNMEGSWCYGNDNFSCQKFGRLYTRNMAKKACPDGWSLPGNTAWGDLINTAGGEKAAGKSLKAKDGWDGTDEYGWSALPGGCRGTVGMGFIHSGLVGFWWSGSASKDLGYFMHSQKDYVVLRRYSKGHGLSVRCARYD